MEQRQPVSLRSSRRFVGEVGIIVVGVLLALAAQEMVQNFHWRTELTEARESLNIQLEESYFASEERVRMKDCTARQLDRLDSAIEGDRPRISDIRIGALRLWSTSAWDAAVSSGAVAHMPPVERNRYASLFAFTAALREINQREFEIASGLDTLVRHPDLTDVSRDRLAQQIAQLKGINRILALGSSQWIEGAKALGLTQSAEMRKELARPQACPMPDDPIGKPS